MVVSILLGTASQAEGDEYFHDLPTGARRLFRSIRLWIVSEFPPEMTCDLTRSQPAFCFAVLKTFVAMCLPKGAIAGKQ